ncbi:MAG: helix-turn-helix transcriptional regulator [Synergistes jonesii]|uniref:helix-turn-helix domain-containing protein n=1 Tax=Synergistes jonesii TaxID=2754 RepID=UPI002A747BF9|nr:helix-turn-helix transcriptional regulator [Synergistes jonesii]MDY2983835.1 helix-turn-helix transcriptional regulator [Synergistes jonesii]
MLADKIRTRRKVLGISQQQLAKISGIAQSSISRYETGEADISLNYILKFAEVLECSPAYLISEELGLDAEQAKTPITKKELTALRTYAKEILAIVGE